MKVLYDKGAPYPVHLMYRGKVWLVHPGDVLELDAVPPLPHFSEVRPKQTKEGEQ